MKLPSEAKYLEIEYIFFYFPLLYSMTVYFWGSYSMAWSGLQLRILSFEVSQDWDFHVFHHI